MTSAITVPFHGSELFIVEHNGQPYTPMKPIVDGMGLDWKSQFVKIKQRFETSMVEITMQVLNDDQGRSYVCLPIRKLAAWLYSVSPNKVKPELRDAIVMHQNECDDVLWDYWTKGQAINKRQSITPEQQAELHAIVEDRAKSSRGIRTEMWSRHNKHFRIAKYSQLLAVHFDDAKRYLETMEIKSKSPEGAPSLLNMLASEASLLITSQIVPLLTKQPDAYNMRFFLSLDMLERKVYARPLTNAELIIDTVRLMEGHESFKDVLRGMGIVECAAFAKITSK